ncbi:MAG TPA: GTP 3',8-cyclase MoaA [Bacteroidales bacterium]
MITDASGRTFKKLRVSLTHECNYACSYCSYGSDDHSQQQSSSGVTSSRPILSTDDLLKIIRKLHDELSLDAVRLTGGEPLLHPRIKSFVAGIYQAGITNIGMTTNGHLLHSRVKDLAEAGLKSVNISIDALTEKTFSQMSRHSGLSRVLRSIDAAMDAGLVVKLNTVIVSGQNHEEILPLLEFALNKGIIIRFLELMAMGPMQNKHETLFFSSTRILEVIGSRYHAESLPRENGSTSGYWSINGRKAFGIIANDSSPFCGDCNRLRLDSYGNIYGCLSSLIPIQVSPETSKYKLKTALKHAISHKQQSHFAGNRHTMQSIGG